MLLVTAFLGVAGGAVHETYERVLVGVTGALIRVVEPRHQDTLLTAVPGGVKVQPAYPGLEPFLIQSFQMHVSAPLILALLLVGGPGPIGARQRLARFAVGVALVFAAHVVALIAQLELTPLKEMGFREPSYYVFRFCWWVGTFWSMLILPAGAALYVYLADFRGLARATPRGRHRRPVLMGLGAVAGAVIVLAAALAHLRPELPSRRPDEGIEAFKAGRYAQAAQVFRTQLEADSSDARARFYLAVSLHRLERFSEAVDEFRVLRSLRSGYPGLDLNLGAALYGMGEREQALQAFEAEADATGLLQVGGTLFDAQDFAGAVRVYRRALQLDATNADASYGLGKSLVAAGEPEQALLFFRRAIDARPGYVEAHKYTGFLHQQAGREAEALAAYQKAVELAPGDHGALLGAALQLLRTQDPCRARRYLDACVQAPGPDSQIQRCRRLLQEIVASCPA